MSSNATQRSESPTSQPRAVALSVLVASHASGGAIEDLLEQQSRHVIMEARDRALLMELAYGVLRRLETIDWRLAPILTKSLARLPVVVQMLLRLGAYQLLFLDRIPASAAVDETVKLAKSYTTRLKHDWSRLVNAVLRNLIRLPAPAFPEPVDQPAEALSVRYALPIWLCERWIDRLGYPRAEALCRASSSIPSLTLRVNRRRLSRQQLLDQLEQSGIPARPTVMSSAGVILEKGQLVTAVPGFKEGDFYVEDEAAQLVPPLLGAQPDEIVLDACAAPGGKTTHLAELMDGRGMVLAMDRKKERLKLLQQNCERLQASIVLPILGDARRAGEEVRRLHLKDASGLSRSHVDRILLDAPCSGLGVLRRHPEAKWKKDTGMFERHGVLQGELLGALSAVLRPGGVLVYSTCSTEQEETEDVVSHFCRTHGEWTRESVAPWLPLTALAFVTDRGALSTLGNEWGMDGFYAARLRKGS